MNRAVGEGLFQTTAVPGNLHRWRLNRGADSCQHGLVKVFLQLLGDTRESDILECTLKQSLQRGRPVSGVLWSTGVRSLHQLASSTAVLCLSAWVLLGMDHLGLIHGISPSQTFPGRRQGAVQQKCQSPTVFLPGKAHGQDRN